MGSFESFDGLKLSYEVEGEGTPVVLFHGFATDAYIQWVRPGITQKLATAGFRTYALDQRGHGMSAKPHDEAAYADGAMVKDAAAFIDHLGLERCFVAGYSMGARNTLQLITQEKRVRAAVLGGVGGNMLAARTFGNAIADAMDATDKSTISDGFARSFRDFADTTRADRVALAAVMRQDRTEIEGLDAIDIPVLVLCGDNDPLVGTPQDLADAIVGAKSVVVGGTHLNVVNNPEFQQVLVDFLSEHRGEVEP